jgi:heavy metal translocating P-type ATPase
MLIELSLIGATIYAYITSSKGKAKWEKQSRGPLPDGMHPDAPAVGKEITGLDEKYQHFVKKRIDPLFGDPRNLQFEALSLNGEAPEISAEEKSVNRFLGGATANMGLGLVALLVYPPLLLATVPYMLWFSQRNFKSACRAIFKEHRVNIAVVDAVFVTWALLSGYLFAGTVGLFLISLSLKLLATTRKHSQQSLINVFGLHSPTVWMVMDDLEMEVPIERLRKGDRIVVNAGEAIAVDGIITDGLALIDQRTLTGESQPAEKGVNDPVLASTIVLSGRIHVQVEKAGPETTAAQICEILNRTTNFTTSLDEQVGRLVDWSAMPTLALGAVALPVVGSGGALAILFSGMGYSLRTLAPLSILNFLRFASQSNILIKDGQALERLKQVNAIVFDKTGTLTLEQFQVKKLYACDGFSEEAVLMQAAVAEYRQTHPIAQAIVAAAHARGYRLPKVEAGRYEVGYGIKVSMANQIIRVGSERFMAMEGIAIPAYIEMIQGECHAEGNSLIMVAIDNEMAGAIALQATIRPEARQVIRRLRQRNLSIYIMSGDHEPATQTLAEELGIDDHFANLLPEDKAERVVQLQKEGKTVCFIGDGINDSIAMQKASVSISLRGATTVATDTAQIILMGEDLAHLPLLLDLADLFDENMKKNLMISIVPGAICIGGVFLLHFGIYASMILYYTGLAVGVVNSISPIKNSQKDGN